jgi:hypothetical protein
MTPAQALDKFGSDCVRDIAAEQLRLGMKASGRSLRSLAYQVAPNGAVVLGSSTFEWQQYGSGPHKGAKVPGWFIRTIAEWARVKGLKLPAFPVARKIWRDGTRIYRKAAPPLGIDAIAAKNTAILAGNLGRGISESLTSDILRNL